MMPTETRESSSGSAERDDDIAKLLDDVEGDVSSLFAGRRGEDVAHGARGAPLPADHFAESLRGDMQLESRRAVTLADLVHPDLLARSHQGLCDELDELFHGRTTPSSGSA